jgi:hypothetical protein
VTRSRMFPVRRGGDGVRGWFFSPLEAGVGESVGRGRREGDDGCSGDEFTEPGDRYVVAAGRLRKNGMGFGRGSLRKTGRASRWG